MKTKKNTGTIPMTFAASAKLFHTSLPREEYIARTLSIVLVVLAIGYISLVSMSVVNVIASKEASDRIAAMRAKVGELEHTYFALTQTVTKDTGSEFGLIPIATIHYVNRVGNVGVANNARNDI
jgi:hypothetical protein